MRSATQLCLAARAITRVGPADLSSSCVALKLQGRSIRDSSGPQMAIPALVSSSFCIPHATRFEVKRKSAFSPNKYTITDEEGGDLLFKVKSQGGFLSHMKRRIYDAASGEVLLVLKQEVPWFGKTSWVAFRGDSESESQVLFTLRKKHTWCSSRILLKGFLPENNDSANPDFSMEAKSWRSRYTVLFNGTPIAKGKRTGLGMVYSVEVWPYVDRAFIAALSMIWTLEHIHFRQQTHGGL